MITVRNAQRALTPPTPWIRGTLGNILAAAGYREWDVGLRITTDLAVARLNRQYRHKEGSTDILSFARHAVATPEAFDGVDAEERDLGDLIVSAPYVRSYCEQTQTDERAHWQVLLTHGVVHLLGYDHETDADFAAMAAREAGILDAIRKLPPVPEATRRGRKLAGKQESQPQPAAPPTAAPMR